MYTFVVENRGTMLHNLTIEGPGIDEQSSPTLDAGTDGDLTVALQKGTYELTCSVTGHKERGMDLKIQVT